MSTDTNTHEQEKIDAGTQTQESHFHDEDRSSIVVSSFLLNHGKDFRLRSIFPEEENSPLMKETLRDMIEEGCAISAKDDDTQTISAKINLEVSRRMLEKEKKSILSLEEKSKIIGDKIDTALESEAVEKSSPVVLALTKEKDEVDKRLAYFKAVYRAHEDTINSAEAVSRFLDGEAPTYPEVLKKGEGSKFFEVFGSGEPSSIDLSKNYITVTELLAQVRSAIEYADTVIERCDLLLGEKDQEATQEIEKSEAQDQQQNEEKQNEERDIVSFTGKIVTGSDEDGIYGEASLLNKKTGDIIDLGKVRPSNGKNLIDTTRGLFFETVSRLANAEPNKDFFLNGMRVLPSIVQGEEIANPNHSHEEPKKKQDEGNDIDDIDSINEEFAAVSEEEPTTWKSVALFEDEPSSPQRRFFDIELVGEDGEGVTIATPEEANDAFNDGINEHQRKETREQNKKKEEKKKNGHKKFF